MLSVKVITTKPSVRLFFRPVNASGVAVTRGGFEFKSSDMPGALVWAASGAVNILPDDADKACDVSPKTAPAVGAPVSGDAIGQADVKQEVSNVNPNPDPNFVSTTVSTTVEFHSPDEIAGAAALPDADGQTVVIVTMP